MRKSYFLFLLCLHSVLAFAQDSVKIDSPKPLSAADSNLVQLFPVFSDQSIGVVSNEAYPDDYAQVDPIRQYGLMYANLGNMGSSAKALVYDAVPDISFDMGFHAFDLYQLRTDQAVFYKSLKPYTKVFFTQLANQSNGFFKASYGRMLSKSLTLHLNYVRLSQLGFYQRQKTKHTGLTIGLWYEPEGSKYKAWLIYGSKYNNQQDNGGITTDTLFNDVIYAQRNAIPVKLSAADTRYVQYEISLGHSYDLIPKKKSALLTLVHNMKVLKQEYKFSETSPDSAFYGKFYTYPQGLRYFAKNTGLYNYFGIRSGFESNRRSFVFEPGISYNRFVITYDTTGYTWNEIWLKSALSGTLGIFSLNAHAQYGLLDSKSNFRVDGEIIGDLGKWAALSAKMIFQQYPGTAMNYSFNISKIPVWENSLEKVTELGLYASLNIKALNLTLNARQFVLDKYIFFDQEALVKQATGTLAITQFSAENNLKFGEFHFNNKVHFQKKSNDIIRYPDWITTHSLYFEGNIFKKHLFIRPGIDVRYLSSYYADNYMPASGQFYLQDKTLLTDQWLADISLGFTISNFQGFVKMENVTRWATNNLQYLTPLYPQPEAKFRIGLQWQFLN